MSCYRPLSGYRSEGGAVSIGFARGAEAPNSGLALPCGRCIGCRLERAKAWSVRCMNEASLWSNNAFVTLTYDEDHLPAGNSLSSRDLTLFLKRLRKDLCGSEQGPEGGRPIRFLAAGEYGGETRRPHYHLLLFNLRLSRGEPVTASTYVSEELSRLWVAGGHSVGDVTPASAAYVSQYCMKKQVTRQLKDSTFVDLRTGENVDREAEFVHMSRRPGIGHWWYERFKSDLKHGYIVYEGKKLRIPRYYEKKLMEDPWFAAQSSERKEQFLYDLNPAERTEDRLIVKEAVARSRRNLFTPERGL